MFVVAPLWLCVCAMHVMWFMSLRVQSVHPSMCSKLISAVVIHDLDVNNACILPCHDGGSVCDIVFATHKPLSVQTNRLPVSGCT